MSRRGTMREIIPHTRRQRVTNLGDGTIVTGPGLGTAIVDWHDEEDFPLVLTVRCTQFSIPADAPVADYRPFALVKWGHGATSVATAIDCTRRQQMQLNASTVTVQPYIAVFAYPGQSDVPALPSGAQATFRGFVARGQNADRRFPTYWVSQIGASGVFAVGPQKLASASVANPSGGTLYFLLFDAAAVPGGGAVPIDAIPVPATGFAEIPMGSNRGFVNGVAWAMSSTLLTLTVSATDVLARAELAS
jgi:hypothetical protein